MRDSPLSISSQAVMTYLAANVADFPEVSRFMDYANTRTFDDGAGETIESGRLGIIPIQVATLFYLARTLKPEFTLETGFGAGISAGILVGAKGADGSGLHISIDPSDRIQNNVVHSYFSRNFPNSFKLMKGFSEVVLPSIVSQYRGKLKLGFVDGGHHFETALLDMFFMDKMLALGGVIVVDDVIAPAVETACNYWIANRQDYAVHDAIPNSLIFEKIHPSDLRSWDHFRPFEVPNRKDWEVKQRA